MTLIFNKAAILDATNGLFVPEKDPDVYLTAWFTGLNNRI